MAQTVKNLEVRIRSLGQENPLEKGMATHSSILAWRIPWSKELGRLQSMGLQSAGHDLMTNINTHLLEIMTLRLQVTNLENNSKRGSLVQ